MPPESSAIATLGWVARAKALVGQSGDRRVGENWLAQHGAPAAATRILKAAVGVEGTGDYPDGVSISGWLDSARTASAFYRILGDGGFLRVPMRTRVVVPTTPATGSVIAEGDAVPLSPLTVQSVLLTPIKAMALIAVTNELLADVSAAGQTFFNRQLMSAISEAVDAVFLDILSDSTGAASNASAGVTATHAHTDLRTALLAIDSGAAARLYWIASVDVAKRASTLADTAGATAFVAMSPSGGELANLPAIVSSGVPSGTLYLVDASGIVADGANVTVDVSGQADISMLDNSTMDGTTPTAAVMTSMWQTNSTALKATAIFGAMPLRDDAVAVVTSINWGS